MTALHPAYWISERDADRIVGTFGGDRLVLPASAADAPEPGEAAPRFDADASGGLDAADVAATLRPAVANLAVRLRPEAAGPVLDAGLGPALAVELCHLLIGLARSTAVAAAECRDRPLQETFVKLSIHHGKRMATLDDAVAALTGHRPEALSPLPTTQAAGLALEDMAARDPLAYAAAVSLFGGPGDVAGADRVLAFARAALDGAPGARDAAAALETWRAAIVSAEESYASVETLAGIGRPFAGDLVARAAERLAPVLPRDLAESCAELATIDQHLDLFVRGIVIFHHDRNEPWPRQAVNWLSA